MSVNLVTKIFVITVKTAADLWRDVSDECPPRSKFFQFHAVLQGYMFTHTT